MAAVLRGIKCESCLKTHDFCLKDIFSSTAQYEYICPDTHEKTTLIVTESTTPLEDKCTDGSVEVFRIKDIP